MSSKILLVVLLFCGLAGQAQIITSYRPSIIPSMYSKEAYSVFGGANHGRDTVQPKKHWHSWSLNKDLTENVKDSAYKYWKLQMIWQDSVSVYRASPGKYPAWVGKYYDRQESQYNRKSIYYKEKQ